MPAFVPELVFQWLGWVFPRWRLAAKAIESSQQASSPAADKSYDLRQQSTELSRVLWQTRLHGSSGNVVRRNET